MAAEKTVLHETGRKAFSLQMSLGVQHPCPCIACNTHQKSAEARRLAQLKRRYSRGKSRR